MKKYWLILSLLFAAICLFGQRQDVVLLKDSTIITGKIIEDKPGEYLKLRVGTGGSVAEYSDIAKVTKNVEAGSHTPQVYAASDTFRIQNFPLRIWYEGKRVKKLGKLEPIVLSKNDLKIRQDWRTSKTIRGIGLGVQAAGVVMMGLSLVQTANYEDGYPLLVGGAATSLGGIVIQIGGISKAKKALRRYNAIEAGRVRLIPGDALPIIRADAPSTNDSLLAIAPDEAAGSQPTSLPPGIKNEIPKPSPAMNQCAAPLKKGSIMVATATGLSLSGGNSGGISFSKEEGVKSSSFNLSPTAGYFFSDGFMGGTSLRYFSSTVKTGTFKGTSTLFLFGPFVRYYGSLPGNAQMKWTLEGGFGFGTATDKDTFNGGPPDKDKTGLFSMSFGPGLAYFLGERVTVEAAAVYERLSTKENGVEDSQGSFGLRLGFGVFL